MPMKIFEWTLRLNGFPIKKAKAHLAKVQSIPSQKYEAHINSLRERILQHHCQNNPFYKSFLEKHSCAVETAWESIPVMDKSILQRPLAERLSEGFSEKTSYIGRTSGSSGIPLVYAKDPFCHALTWAENMDRFGWHGINLNTSYQARFYGIPLERKKYYKELIKDRFAKRQRFPIFDLSEEKLAYFLSVFRKKRFHFINGLTSAIVLFAKYLQANNIILTEVCPTLKLCVVTSEMLFEDDRKLLEESLGVRVINEYGASELDLIAFENTEGKFQLNSETLFVELLDDEGNEVPKGQPGRIIITSLYNKAHPFIRYDVGDIGIMDTDSTFKKPILKKLIGRANDNAVLPNGATIPGHTFYYVTKTALGIDSPVKEFIVEQHQASLYKMVYVAGRDLNLAEKNHLEETIERYIKAPITLQLERKELLDRSNRGKLKQFISYL